MESNTIMKRYAPTALCLIFIAVCSALLDYFTPSSGDDLMFWKQLGLTEYKVPNRATVSFVGAHIFGCNGRLFDFMGPIVVDLLPRALAAAVMGLMAGLFFFSILLASGLTRLKSAAGSLIMMAVTLAVMPWWDSMWLRVCQFNYLWASAFCLLFIYFYFRATASSKGNVGLLMLGGLAGACHEQTAVAMCVAFFVWVVTGRRYRRLTGRHKVMLAGLLLGSCLPLFAPAIWHRAATGEIRQELLPLIYTTIPLMVLLWLVIAVVATFGSGRAFIRRLAKTPWLVVVTAGSVAAIIALAAGVPGRTGMFSEACGLVGFARMLLAAKPRIGRIAATTFAAIGVAFIALHFVLSISEQKSLYREYTDILQAYVASADGIVYSDFTGRYDVSPLTLYRVKGCPDSDDLWNLHALQQAYKPDGNELRLLPPEFEGRLESLTDALHVGNVSVYARSPDSVVITRDSLLLQRYPGPTPRHVSSTKLPDGRTIWIATERIRDPGDYELDVVR